MEIALGLVVGLAIGVVLGVVGHWRASPLRAQSASLREDLEEVKRQLQDGALALTAAETKLSGSEGQVKSLTGERDQARRERDQISGELSDITAKLAKTEADHAARRDEMESYRAELETRFKGIASSVTQSTRDEFIKEFRDLTKQQSEVSKEAVTNLVKPVRERLTELQQYVDESDKKRASDYANVINGRQERLLEETSRPAARRCTIRASADEWGEQHLRNVMQAAGMTDHVDFVEQQYFASESGSGRPDVVVHIPGGVQVVVDAKTPFEAYDAAMKTEDEAERSRLFTSHASDLLTAMLGRSRAATTRSGCKDRPTSSSCTCRPTRCWTLRWMRTTPSGKRRGATIGY